MTFSIKNIAPVVVALAGFWTASTAQAQPVDLEQYTFFRSQGYAQLLAVTEDGEIEILQETDGGIVPADQGLVADDTIYEVTEDENGETVAFPWITGLEETETGFIGRELDGTVRRFDLLPEAPDKPLYLEEDADPVLSLEIFGQLIEENYAYFELSDLDWQEIYGRYRPMVDSGTSPDQLFDILSALLSELKDGHGGFLIAEQLDRSYGPSEPRPSAWMMERADEMLGLIASGTDSGFRSFANDRILVATFDDGRIGYLNILSFIGFAERLVDNHTVFVQELDRILTELSSTEALVIDLRWNTGGLTRPPLALAARFASSVLPIHRKQARSGDGFTQLEAVYLEPEGVSYLGRPVMVLTSDWTISAGDVAAGNLGELPNVTLMGRNTWGGFSNLLEGSLPNGWTVLFSNERYLWGDGDGVDLERIGVTPDIVEWPSLDALNAGRDNALERALAELGVDVGDGGGDSCTEALHRLCLNQDRFAVEVAWRDFQGGSGVGRSTELSDETGHFWFFDPKNVELVVKVIDGRAVNGRFWVFFGSLTNVEMTITVTDTETGAAKTYHNPSGQFASFGDTSAFTP